MTWTNEACTLPTEELPLRRAEFDALFAETLEGVEQTSDRSVRMLLRGQGGTETRVRDLVAREAECCSFFTFHLTRRTPEEPGCEVLDLDVSVPAAQAHVLAALGRRATNGRLP